MGNKMPKDREAAAEQSWMHVKYGWEKDFLMFSLSKSAENKRIRVQPRRAADEVPEAMGQRESSALSGPGVCPDRTVWLRTPYGGSFLSVGFLQS